MSGSRISPTDSTSDAGEGLAAFHTHGKYLLDKSAEPLQLFLADAQVFVALRLVFRLVKVQQGIVGGVGDGDRGFQLMGDVVGEVAFISSSVFCRRMVRISTQNAKIRIIRMTSEVASMLTSYFNTSCVTGSIKDGSFGGIEVEGVVVLLGVRAGGISGSTGNGQRVHECVGASLSLVDMLQTVGQRDAPVFQLKAQQAVVPRGRRGRR